MPSIRLLLGTSWLLIPYRLPSAPPRNGPVGEPRSTTRLFPGCCAAAVTAAGRFGVVVTAAACRAAAAPLGAVATAPVNIAADRDVSANKIPATCFTANLPISHSAVRSVQAGILLESAPRTGDGRNGTRERFAPCAGPSVGWCRLRGTT